MDRELSAGYRRKMYVKRVGSVLLFVLALVVIGYFLRSVLEPGIESGKILIERVERGDIEETITASGSIRPESEIVLTSPHLTKIVRIMHREGDLVTRGDPIVELNKQTLLLDYQECRSEFDLQKNRKRQLGIDMERNTIDLMAQLEIKRLQLKSVEAKLKQEYELDRIGATTKGLLEEAAVNVAIAKLECERLEKKIKNRQNQADADIEEVDLRLHIQQKKIAELERQLELAEVRATTDGVVTWVQDQVGESLRPGDEVARLADLSSYKVEARVSDHHSSQIQKGRLARIRLRGTDLTGRIKTVRPTIQNRTILFEVELDDKKHRLLRPNQSVEVFIITARRENVVRIKNGPFVNGSGPHDIFFVRGNQAIRRSVQIGMTNVDYVEISEGAQPGEAVIISNMEKYLHHPEITIKN